MHLDHPDYIKLVKATYNKKRANNELSTLLAQSTPANIRQECWYVYKKQYDSGQILKKDEQILWGFFGPSEPGKKFLDVIGKFAADKFRPLDNYLKGDTEKTDRSNLELLAWLIDFQHRPYVFMMDVTLNEDELLTIGKSNGQPNLILKQNFLDEKEEGDTGIEDEKKSLKTEPDKTVLTDDELTINLKTVSKEKMQKKKRRRIIITILIASACLIYFIWQQERNRQARLGFADTGCMYWADDHYEQMPCNEKRKDRFKLPMDAERMKNFKRILNEDTITERSIGQVYYIRIDGRIEYYTTGGNHPIEVTRRLWPLSTFMFDKHLRKPKIITMDSLPE